MSKLNGKWINKDADHLTHSGDDLKIRFSDSEAPDTNKVWSSAKINTISGTLQTDIDGKADTSHGHTSGDVSDFDEAAQDAVGNVMSGAGAITVTYDDAGNTITVSGEVGGSTDHSALSNLDYASAGHTGFAADSHTHTEADVTDLDKYTQAEVTTISGVLQTQIDAIDIQPNEIEYFTLAGGDITNKYVTLANTPYSNTEVGLDIIGGCAQFYGTDYSVVGTQVTWSGLALDGVFETGDEFRVIYSY